MKKSVLLLGFIGLFFSFAVPLGQPLFAAEPIKIGVVLSITGRGGFLGTPQKDAMTAIVDEVNAKGGVLGRPIELIIEDDQSNPTNSAVAATKLIRDKKVSAVLGASLVVGCMAIIPICEQEQVPHLALAPITTPLKKWTFGIPLTDYRLAQRMLRFTVETLGARKIALLHSSDTYGVAGIQGIIDHVGDYKGVSIVATEKCEPSDTNMIPQLSKIKLANPDALILFVNAGPAGVVAKNYQQLGITWPVIGSGGIPTPEFLKLAGPAIEGGKWMIFGCRDLHADRLPPNDPWRNRLYDPLISALEKKLGGKVSWNAFYRNGADPMYVIIEALKIAKSDDRSAVRDALEKIKYEGMMGTYQYTATDHEGTKGEMFEPLIVKEGKWWPYKK